MWLNNCVGKQNIVAFYLLLTGAAAMMLTQIAVGAYNIYVFTTPDFAARLTTYYPGASALGIFVVMLAIWLITIVVLGLVLQLLSFHSLLVLRDLTTYDFIVQRGQERQGLEVVPGHGSSLAVFCYGYRKASPMTQRDHAAAAALYQQPQQHGSDPHEVGLELRDAAAEEEAPPPPPPPPPQLLQPPQPLAPAAAGGAAASAQPAPAPAPAAGTQPKRADPYADLI